MTDERLILAIGRIERALSRIESQALAPTAREPGLSELQTRYDQLDERHRRLRARANESVYQLCLLLETQQAG
jgi:hypothetical protein